MIDVQKEIERYKPVEIHPDIKNDQDITALLTVFNKTIERIGKEQYKFVRQFDEITEILEKNIMFEKLIDTAESKLVQQDTEISKLLSTVIEICDLTEDMYLYGLNSSNKSFSDQVKLQWSMMQQALAKSGIIRFGSKGDIYDRQLHNVKKVRQDPGYVRGQVIDVLKSGYGYKDKIIRKAEVIIYMTDDEK